MIEYATSIKDKFNDKLLNYNFMDNVNNVSLGHYVRYVDLYGEHLYSGGVIVKIDDTKIYFKSLFNKKIYNIIYNKWYVFYKEPEHKSSFRKFLEQYMK